MKYLYNKVIFLMALLFLVGSCEEEDNLQPEGNWELTPPTIVAPAVGNDIVLEASKATNLITFSWSSATSTLGYGVYYSVALVDSASDNFDNPIVMIPAENGKKGLAAAISYADLDTALSLAGYPANKVANISWFVVATSLSKIQTDRGELKIKRFVNEIIPTQLFLSGEATETGADLSMAISFKRLNNSSGNPSNIYEIYTSLKKDKEFKFYSERSLPAHIYGGENDNLVKSGNSIKVTEDGQYRITVNLDSNTYSLLKIERWNVKGSPIIGGWGSDEPLEYIGGGVWKATIELVGTGGFLFRADVNGKGYWDFLLKRVVGTANKVIMESQAGSQGVSYEDIPSEIKGTMIFTLDLSSNAYTFSIEKDPNAVGPIETPESLFLFINNVMKEELTKDGDVFKTSKFSALKKGDKVTLNTLANGNGESYTIQTAIGATDKPDDVKVTVNSTLIADNNPISVERDQAYLFSVDFANSKFQWNYYNIFMFHWDEINQKWDNRNEFLMTYVHPFKFTTKVDLKADFDIKFFSPWDNDFGSDSPSALTGTMTNKGGSNFRNIKIAGSYNVTITLTDDFQKGSYEFVKQ